MYPHILAMHIPDGFLSVPVSAVGWVLLIGLVWFALRQTRSQLGERQTPLLGVLAAFVFAAQMINFPVAGGTSGHLLGGVLVAILLGPWATVLVMTCVIGVQGLLFQDGGLLALGFNVFNMGILSGFIGYAAYRRVYTLMGQTPTAQLVGAALGAWLGVVLASLACALELAASGTSPAQVAVPAMVGIHMVIGIGEALITLGAIVFIRRARPDLLDTSKPVQAAGYGWIATGLVLALVVALASPLANGNPDGLERVAADHGFLNQAHAPSYTIMPDYTVPLVHDEHVTTMAAGVIGVVVVSGLGFGVARAVSRKHSHAAQSGEHPQT